MNLFDRWFETPLAILPLLPLSRRRDVVDKRALADGAGVPADHVVEGKLAINIVGNIYFTLLI